MYGRIVRRPYNLETTISFYYLQKLFLLTPGHIHIISISQFYLPAIPLDIPFDVVQVDDIGMMESEESIRK